MIVVVVPPKRRFSKRILFICDVSGSMSGRPFSKTLQAMKMIASQPVDDMEMGIIAFADHPTRWTPSKKKTWVKLPSAKAVKAAEEWLIKQGASGGTRIVPALRMALKDPAKDLSIVIVTDGVFMETNDAVVEVVQELQKKRAKSKCGKAIIGVIGVGGIRQDVLKSLGEVGEGGYYDSKSE